MSKGPTKRQGREEKEKKQQIKKAIEQDIKKRLTIELIKKWKERMNNGLFLD